MLMEKKIGRATFDFLIFKSPTRTCTRTRVPSLSVRRRPNMEGSNLNETREPTFAHQYARTREADDVESPSTQSRTPSRTTPKLRTNGECQMSRNEIRHDNRSMHADGCGDGGERFLMTGLPGWLHDRIESVAIPEDRDLYFRDVVTALAGRGWDSFRITIAIAARAWIPERNAGRHLRSGASNR